MIKLSKSVYLIGNHQKWDYLIQLTNESINH
jgi:hypothetical protein